MFLKQRIPDPDLRQGLTKAALDQRWQKFDSHLFVFWKSLPLLHDNLGIGKHILTRGKEPWTKMTKRSFSSHDHGHAIKWSKSTTLNWSRKRQLHNIDQSYFFEFWNYFILSLRKVEQLSDFCKISNFFIFSQSLAAGKHPSDQKHQSCRYQHFSHHHHHHHHHHHYTPPHNHHHHHHHHHHDHHTPPHHHHHDHHHQLRGDQSIADEIAAVNTSTNFSLFTLLRFAQRIFFEKIFLSGFDRNIFEGKSFLFFSLQATFFFVEIFVRFCRFF